MPETFNGYVRGRPDVDWWLKAINAGLAFRKRYAYEDRWPLWRAFYRGEFDESILPINLFFKMLRTMVPRVYFRNPSVSITPTQPGHEHMVLAQLLERLDNKLITNLGIKRQMKKMVHDAFLFGTAIGKHGFGSEFNPTPDMITEEAPADKRGWKVEYNSNVKANMPWFLRVHTGRFIVPSGLEDWDSCRWCAHWIRRDIDDVRKDQRLSNTSKLEPNRQPLMDRRQKMRHGDPAPADQVDLVEISDKKTGMAMVLAPYAGTDDKPLYFGPDDRQVDGELPFEILIFNEDDEFFWGLADAKVLDPQQREANEIRTQVMQHRRMSVRKLLAEIGAFASVDDEAKLTDERVSAIIKLKQGGLQMVKEMTGGDIPEALIKAGVLVDQDVNEMLGFGSNQFGEYAPGSADRSATEANIVNMATQIRTDERRDMVADMLVRIVDRMNETVFTRWDGEMVLDVVGPAGIQVWLEFTPQMLKRGNFDTKIDPDSGIPQTKAYREQRAMGLYKLLATNPLINPMKLTQYLLHELHGTQFDEMLIQGPGNLLQMGSPQQPIPAGQYAQQLPQLQGAANKAMIGASRG